MIIHYVGDIHQPLHSTAKVDSTYPSGDFGGNKEKLPSTPCGASNLHSVWDSVAYLYCGYPTLPFTSSNWDYYQGEVDAMVDPYPIDTAKIAPGQFQEWANQSYNEAINYVYPGK